MICRTAIFHVLARAPVTRDERGEPVPARHAATRRPIIDLREILVTAPALRPAAVFDARRALL